MITFLFTRVGRLLSAFVAGVVFILTFGVIQRRKGADEAENKALRKAVERQREGRDAVDRMRGADRDKLLSQLRKRRD